MNYNNEKYEVPTYYKTINEALKLAKDAVEGEREDELFYDYIISIAPTREEKDIIASIRDDEMKHNKMFREIYKYYTGQDIVTPRDVRFEKPKSYEDGLKKALFGELSAVEKYRDIRAGLPNEYYRDMVFEILTDEQKHADKYNYLLNLNNSEEKMEESYTPDEWVGYIEPLVEHALDEVKEGINPRHLFQEFILMGVLVGMGEETEDAYKQVEMWEKTGASKLLVKSKKIGGSYERNNRTI
ncbi:MAG TPA: rubrerythrin [Clostridiales bacterium]|nr:MAG: rubrerythrin [Clostridiales bacterium GWD2_32_59]HAN10707.1 rubrerythrin [Clostridiales bacterium]